MHDIYNQLEDSTTWQTIIQWMNSLDKHYHSQPRQRSTSSVKKANDMMFDSNIFFEDSKISIHYVLMHRLKAINMTAQIDYLMFDDSYYSQQNVLKTEKPYIVNVCQFTFTRAPWLIPHDVCYEAIPYINNCLHLGALKKIQGASMDYRKVAKSKDKSQPLQNFLFKKSQAKGYDSDYKQSLITLKNSLQGQKPKPETSFSWLIGNV